MFRRAAGDVAIWKLRGERKGINYSYMVTTHPCRYLRQIFDSHEHQGSGRCGPCDWLHVSRLSRGIGGQEPAKTGRGNPLGEFQGAEKARTNLWPPRIPSFAVFVSSRVRHLRFLGYFTMEHQVFSPELFLIILEHAVTSFSIADALRLRLVNRKEFPHPDSPGLYPPG